MSNLDTCERIQKSWDIRTGLIEGILDRGKTLTESFKLAPEMRAALTFEQWKDIVARELEEATALYGNGEPLLSEQELISLATIMNPKRGW